MSQIELTDRKKIHFVGIGGSGMGPLAHMLMDMGLRVSGSDRQRSEMTDSLVRRGAVVHIGHDASFVDSANAVVVSTAVAPDNPEVVGARQRGIPVLHRSELLAAIMGGKKSIAVTGTHGKTTTTAMVAIALRGAGLDPSAVVGGVVAAFGGGAFLGRDPYIVVEADESDRSFLNLKKDVAVATNIDNDHLDHWGTMEELCNGFVEFLSTTSADGFAVLGVDNAYLAAVAPRVRGRVVSFGMDPGAEVHPGDVTVLPWGSRSEVYWHGQKQGVLHLAIPGRHNIQNALAALAVGLEMGLPFNAMSESLATFPGVGRRQEVLGVTAGVTVIADYGHHPTEVKATIEAIKPNVRGRLVVVFQPHRYTRTLLTGRDFPAAFASADLVLVTDIYSAGESPIPGVSAAIILEGLARRGHPPYLYVPSVADVPQALIGQLQPGDTVVLQGAGDVNRAAGELLRLLKAEAGEPE